MGGRRSQAVRRYLQTQRETEGAAAERERASQRARESERVGGEDEERE
jgi:hypothetical protein